jgi:GMP synthase-like glutamine amidotransferase
VKIAILETGAPPAPLKATWGGYPAMFERLLSRTGLAFEARTFDVAAGELPEDPGGWDAQLITGSPAGVYDDLPWIAPLCGYLNAARGRTRLVGVCFGHQVMAQAFGGRVIKSPKGWGIGLHTYEVFEPQPWMDGADPVSVPVSHQDQVVELPPGGRAVAGNAFCPNGVIAYEDGSSISVQHHPEFDPAYAAALVERRLGTAVDEAEGRAAIETLSRPNDRLRVGGWIRRFLEG